MTTQEQPLPKEKSAEKAVAPGTTQWYAIYTKPRWEKKVHAMLERSRINSWCPVQKVMKQWSDRKKMVEEVLFRSYVFVHIDFKKERLDVLTVDGVLNFVHYLGKPAIIKDEEIDNIKRYLGEKDAKIDLKPAASFSIDTKVKVSAGVFMDNEGVVIQTGKKKVYVEIRSLGQIMVVEFPIEVLKPIDTK